MGTGKHMNFIPHSIDIPKQHCCVTLDPYLERAFQGLTLQIPSKAIRFFFPGHYSVELGQGALLVSDMSFVHSGA